MLVAIAVARKEPQIHWICEHSAPEAVPSRKNLELILLMGKEGMDVSA